MLDNTRVWMTRKAYIGLQMRLAALRADRPHDRSAAHRAQIERLDALIARASVDTTPPDDGIAEPGMVVTVRSDSSGGTDTFLLGLRGAEDVGIEVYSPDSPLGSALVEARVGQRRSYRAADGTRKSVTLLNAAPYDRESSKNGATS